MSDEFKDRKLTDLARQRFLEPFLQKSAQKSGILARRFYSLATDIENIADRINQRARRLSYRTNFETQERYIYHEAGHAVLTTVLPGNGEVTTLNLLGDASIGGFVGHKHPSTEQLNKDNLINIIAMTLGGMAAEEIKYGDDQYCPGVKHDVESATTQALNMITDCGMSNRGIIHLGLLKDKRSKLSPFRKQTRIAPYISDCEKDEILKEVRDILAKARLIARQTLKTNWSAVERLVETGRTKNILTGQEVREIINGAPRQLEIPEL